MLTREQALSVKEGDLLWFPIFHLDEDMSITYSAEPRKICHECNGTCLTCRNLEPGTMLHIYGSGRMHETRMLEYSCNVFASKEEAMKEVLSRADNQIKNKKASIKAYKKTYDKEVRELRSLERETNNIRIEIKEISY